jgi:hypothetical protein
MVSSNHFLSLHLSGYPSLPDYFSLPAELRCDYLYVRLPGKPWVGIYRESFVLPED